MCARGDLCETVRADTSLERGDYSPLHYIWFCLYAPLYLAGPTATYNGAVSCLRSPQRAMAWRDIARYAVRWLGLLAGMELLLSRVYAWTFRSVWLDADLSVYQLGHLCHWSLFLLWLKFACIWRFTRCWALADGVDVRENMLRCVNNNYTLTGFWKA